MTSKLPLSAAPAAESEDIPIREHYRIRRGGLNLPWASRVELIRERRRLGLLLGALGRLYIELLCQGELQGADRALACLRSLEEPDFSAVFQRFGFPDEPERVHLSTSTTVPVQVSGGGLTVKMEQRSR